jgi:2OG-Fe(II) oxygenase superfamily
MPKTAQSALLQDVLLSIENYLNPAWLEAGPIETVKAHLTAGALVVIRNAFKPAFAERIFGCLDTCTAWKVHEGGEADFHYHHHNLDVQAFPPDLAVCGRVFDSPASRDFATRLSGKRCTGSTVFSASWYLPGDHSLPHNDAISDGTSENRQVAFIWHLAKKWRPEWGGALFWCPRSVYLAPVFNSLVLFNVGPDTYHFVTAVSPYALGKRLTINGWWTGSDPTRSSINRASGHIDNGSMSIEIY